MSNTFGVVLDGCKYSGKSQLLTLWWWTLSPLVIDWNYSYEKPSLFCRVFRLQKDVCVVLSVFPLFFVLPNSLKVVVSSTDPRKKDERKFSRSNFGFPLRSRLLLLKTIQTKLKTYSFLAWDQIPESVDEGGNNSVDFLVHTCAMVEVQGPSKVYAYSYCFSSTELCIPLPLKLLRILVAINRWHLWIESD